MKKLLILLFILSGCAKPYQNPADDFYVSTYSLVSGLNIPCQNCFNMEKIGNIIKLTYTSHPEEECSNQGTLDYVIQNNSSLPSDTNTQVSWTVSAMNQVGSNEPHCFPPTMDIFIDFLSSSPNEIQFSFLGKSYTLRKGSF